jgi:hypothetical protein
MVGYKKQSVILLVSCVYLVFSCLYVLLCNKNTATINLLKINHPAVKQAKLRRGGVSVKFLSRPRVIVNRIVNIVVEPATIILFLAVCFRNVTTGVFQTRYGFQFLDIVSDLIFLRSLRI